jgi:hypothetical protein
MHLWLAIAAVVTLRGTYPQAGTLSGTARDLSGAGVPGVRVILAGSPEEKVVITDGRGEYRFDGVPPATYRLKAQLAGFFDIDSPPITVEPGRTAIWHPVMRVLPIRGTDGVVSSILSWTGPDAVDCGRHPIAAPAEALNRSLVCVKEAVAARRPFWTFKEEQGFDSRVGSGLLRTTDGRVLLFHWDSDPCGGAGCPPRFAVEPCVTPAINSDSTRFVCKG